MRLGYDFGPDYSRWSRTGFFGFSACCRFFIRSIHTTYNNPIEGRTISHIESTNFGFPLIGKREEEKRNGGGFTGDESMGHQWRQRASVRSSSAAKSFKGTWAAVNVCCILSQPLEFAALHGPHQTFFASSFSGVVLERKLKKLPKERCWCVGSSEVVDALDMASTYNQIWNTDLIIGRHDCRHYTNGLVEYLTGEENILERLRRSE